MYFFRLPSHLDRDRVVGYYRVSTSKQEKHGHALDRYREQLLEFGILAQNIFFDVESGGSEAREGFNEVLRRCQEGAIAVVFPELSRFMRSVLIGENVRHTLAKLGTQLIEADTGKTIDLFSADGIREWQLKNAQAEYIRNMSAQHSLRGHARRRQQEKPLVACFGYLIEGDRYVINHNPYWDSGKTVYEVAREAIATFKELRSYSKTIRSLCDRCGMERKGTKRWEDFPRDHSAFRDWIQSPVLRGHLVYFRGDRAVRLSAFQEPVKEIVIFNKHSAIIQPEEDALLIRIFQNITSGKKPDEPRNPLAGKLFCAGCGSSMIRKQCNGYDYLVCRGAYPVAGKPRICDRRSSYGLNTQKAIDATIAALCSKADAIAQWGYSDLDPITDSPEIIALREAITKLQVLNDPDLAGAISAKLTKLSQLERERQTDGVIGRDRVEQLRQFAQNTDFWLIASTLELKILFSELVARVDCDRGAIVVQLLV